MTLLGIILAVAGIAGIIIVYTGLIILPSALNNMTIWVGALIVGAVLAILTRRPMD